MFKPVQCYLLARQVLDLVADRPSKIVLIFYEKSGFCIHCDRLLGIENFFNCLF